MKGKLQLGNYIVSFRISDKKCQNRIMVNNGKLILSKSIGIDMSRKSEIAVENFFDRHRIKVQKFTQTYKPTENNPVISRTMTYRSMKLKIDLPSLGYKGIVDVFCYVSGISDTNHIIGLYQGILYN